MNPLDRPLVPETDDTLLADCDMEAFRGSGPGGQHRNKTETGVRLLHRPSGILVQASERRSRTQNIGVALDRLREQLTELRRPPPPKRRATRPTRGSQERRHEGKRIRAHVKRGRGKVGDGD